jgi:DNA-binding MarR family transcriptional regulator
MPILGYGLYSRGGGPGDDQYLHARLACDQDGDRSEDSSALALPWLFARVLLALAIHYERQSRISIAIAANLLRLLDNRGVRLRDLPELTGVSKEAIAMATGFTGSADVTTMGADPAGGRWKVVRLTPKGQLARDRYTERLESIEERWCELFGSGVIADVRAPLERLAGAGGPGSPLFAGIEPGPRNWRSDVRPPQTLPHFPMVLHRGGYPDGS